MTYIEEILVEDIARIYVKEVFAKHRALSKIYSSILRGILSRVRS